MNWILPNQFWVNNVLYHQCYFFLLLLFLIVFMLPTSQGRLERTREKSNKNVNHSGYTDWTCFRHYNWNTKCVCITFFLIKRLQINCTLPQTTIGMFKLFIDFRRRFAYIETIFTYPTFLFGSFAEFASHVLTSFTFENIYDRFSSSRIVK